MSDPHSVHPFPIRWCVQRFDEWANARQPDMDMELGPSAQFWGNPKWSLFCCLVLIATLAMPADGLGIRLCLFHQMTGMDCPGCGMTRGISHFWRGHFLQALQLHLFAPAAFLFLFVQGSSLFFMKPWKAKILHYIDRHDSWFRYIWLVGGASFFVYGGLRIAYEIIDQGYLRGI